MTATHTNEKRPSRKNAKPMLPSVLAAFLQLSAPPSTSSTSFFLRSIDLLICKRFVTVYHVNKTWIVFISPFDAPVDQHCICTDRFRSSISGQSGQSRLQRQARGRSACFCKNWNVAVCIRQHSDLHPKMISAASFLRSSKLAQVGQYAFIGYAQQCITGSVKEHSPGQ